MNVEDLMIRSVTCCEATQNLAEIAELLWRDRRGSLPVLGEGGLVTSIITDRDICIALGTRNARASEIRVRDVVPLRVFTCHPRDNALTALNTMVTQNVRRLPVVDEDNKLVGILSIDDLIRRAALQLSGEAKFHVAVMRGVKAICEAREPGAAHDGGELLAAHA